MHELIGGLDPKGLADFNKRAYDTICSAPEISLAHKCGHLIEGSIGND